MNNLFKPEMTLQQMNEILESYCLNSAGSAILAVQVIPLTYEDYTHMRDLLFSYVNYTGDVSAYFGVQLCIIVTWIFGEKYQNKSLSSIFTDKLMTLPQHHLKSYCGMLASTMIEYNLETYGEDYENFTGICSIIHKQAGI